MSKLLKVLIGLFIFVDIILIGVLLLSNQSFPILEPKGLIAQEEKKLFMTVLLLGTACIVPTLIIAFLFVFRYSEEKQKTIPHSEKKNHKDKVQAIFWIFPAIIIFFLSLLVWKSTHALDPHKPIESTVKPLTIQVVALQWRWLFIYPEQNIASINYVVFPENTPLVFELTADSPMNSFWIPHLGGQMYAMEGMVNKMHLIANEEGEFPGSNAEISGEGFAGMRFLAKATSDSDFNSWVNSIKKSDAKLTANVYNQLAIPSEDSTRRVYSSVDKDLYNNIVNKFMPPKDTSHETGHTEGM